jgi:hypothetical protein
MSAEMPGAPVAPSVDFGPKASYGGIITSLPFEALYEATLTTRAGRGIGSGAIYRDSTGRVRREYRIQESGALEPNEWAVVTDFATHSVVVLNPATQSAISFEDFGPPARRKLLEGWGYHGCWSSEAGGEERTIEGVLCRKVARIGWPLGTALKVGETGEIWISDEIKYSVFERLIDPEQEYTWRLYNIRRKEPPESMFGIPAGYAVVSRSKLDPVG